MERRCFLLFFRGAIGSPSQDVLDPPSATVSAAAAAAEMSDVGG